MHGSHVNCAEIGVIASLGDGFGYCSVVGE